MPDTDLSSLIDNLTNGTTSTFTLVVSVLMVVAWWKIFEKANEPGWAAIIPLYNLYVFFKITWGNGLYCLLMIIPVINLVVYVMTIFKMCSAFGKGIGFSILSLFLPSVTTLILGFGSAQYQR